MAQNDMLRTTWLRRFLRVLSVGFIGTFGPWITLILLNGAPLGAGSRFAPLLRFQPYNASYESMLAAIHIVWAVMLWRASMDPVRHRLFVDFTMRGTAAHGVVMIIATRSERSHDDAHRKPSTARDSGSPLMVKTDADQIRVRRSALTSVDAPPFAWR